MIQPAKRLKLFFLASLPALITLLLSIFYLTAKHMHGLNMFMPILPLLPVFYWGLTHAREMPYWFVFIIGLLLDAIMGMPLGASSFLYVLFLLLLHMQRKYIHKEGFVIKWGYFAVLLLVTTNLNWIILLLFSTHTEGFAAALVQWFLTVCCYPFFHKCFDYVYHYMQSERWEILHGS